MQFVFVGRLLPTGHPFQELLQLARVPALSRRTPTRIVDHHTECIHGRRGSFLAQITCSLLCSSTTAQPLITHICCACSN